jgi:hypothetical protein
MRTMMNAREELFCSLQEPFFLEQPVLRYDFGFEPPRRVCRGIQTRVVALESCRAP